MMFVKLGIPTEVDDGLGYPIAEPKDLFRHSLVIGSSGTGKSTYLINILLQLIDSPIILLDPNGFLAKDFAPYVPPDRLIYVNRNFPISLNPLDLPCDRSTIANGLMQVINNSVKEVSPAQVEVSMQMRDIIRNALRIFKPEQFTIKYLSDFLRYEKLRKNTGDIYWETFDKKMNSGYPEKKEPIESANRIAVRLSLFIEDENMRPFVEGGNQFNIENIIRNKKVVIFDLSGIDDENTAFIGGLIANQLKNYYIQKTDKNSEPLYFFVDECQLFVNTDYSRFLAEARKYQIGCGFSIHSFTQVDKELASMLMACHIKICLGVEDEDSKRIANSFGLTDREIRSIKKHEGIVKIGSDVHSIICYPPPETKPFVRPEAVINKYNFLKNSFIPVV